MTASMNEGISFALGLITGLGIGFTAVLIMKNRERIRHEEEIQSVKDAYRNAFGVVPPKNDKSEPFKGKEKENAIAESKEKIDYNRYASLVRDTVEVSKLVTGNQYEPEKPTDEEELLEQMEEEEDHPSEGYPQAPFVITPEEFAAEPEYSKEDLYYYILSDSLVDEHDVEVDDIDRLIGYDNLRHIGDIEPDCLWVRNPNTMSDYQIVGIHNAWEGS